MGRGVRRRFFRVGTIWCRVFDRSMVHLQGKRAVKAYRSRLCARAPTPARAADARRCRTTTSGTGNGKRIALRTAGPHGVLDSRGRVVAALGALRTAAEEHKDF